MQYSVLLLTASLFPAAPGDVPADSKAQAPAPAVQATTTAMPVDAASAPKPTFGQRLRNFFTPQRPERPEAPVIEPRNVHVAAPTASTPATDSGPRATLGAPVTTVTALRPSYDLADNDLRLVGHEQDYSWITGKLFHAPGANGRLLLRYTAPYEQDRYSGAVLLTGAQELASYHEGDLVCVHGKVVDSARGSGNATYHVNSVDLIQRGPQ